MKFSNVFTLTTTFLLASGAVARPRSKTTGDESGPVSERSRVTAFVNTENGIEVECWEIGDLLPQSRSDGVRALSLNAPDDVTLYSFAPSTTIFDLGSMSASSNDFRKGPNLFTVKNGLIYVEASHMNGDASTMEASEQFFFDNENGDDWFYFEDSTTSSNQRKKSTSSSELCARTVSGDDTTLINFRYHKTPSHKVLHKGRCNFTGLRPIDDNKGKGDEDIVQVQVTIQT